MTTARWLTRQIALTALLLTLSGPAFAQFVYPLSGKLGSSYYTVRSYGYHKAHDVHGSMWTPIRAARAGRVSFAGWSGGYGNLIKIDHGAGYPAYYAHQGGFASKVGQSVSSGQTIGYVGSTGNSDLPHLHFEIRRYGAKQYLPGKRPDWLTQGKAIPHSYPGLSGGGGGGGTPTSTKVLRITANLLNVRSGPSTGYAIKGQIPNGQRYVRMATSGSWQQIWWDGGTAWIHGSYTAAVNEASAARITVGTLNVRTGPSTGYSKVGQVHNGEHYARAGGTSGSWIQFYFKGALRWSYGPYTQTVTVP